MGRYGIGGWVAWIVDCGCGKLVCASIARRRFSHFPYIMQHSLLLLFRATGAVCLVLVFGLLCFQLGFPSFYLFIYFGVIKFHALVPFSLVPFSLVSLISPSVAFSQRLCFIGPQNTDVFKCTAARFFVAI